jgi:hypothetical protein
MNGEISLDDYLDYFHANQKFFIPAHYDHALMLKNREIAAELIVPWLYVMGACIFSLFTLITALLLDCLK